MEPSALNGDSPLLSQRPTLNPYRYALRSVLERLKWDLTWEAARSRGRLRDWKDRFPGQKAVIVCNGPTLLQTDLAALQGIFTFGLNKINLLFERSSFRPSVIVAVNELVLEQNAPFYNTTDIPLFLAAPGRRFIQRRANVTYLHFSDQSKFARDCSVSMQQGFTVTYVAMQLAFHMGFRRVALVGCDHNFASKGPANATVTAGAKDDSHFDSRYFSGGVKWQLPDLAGSEYYYSLARDVFQAFGGAITNCTEGGRLEILPRKTLQSWLSE